MTKLPFTPLGHMINWFGLVQIPGCLLRTKSAHDLVADKPSQRHGENLWKMVLKVKGLQRIRIFLWKLLNNGILCNAVRVRRHMGSSDICPLCHTGTEDLLHAFRDCSSVLPFWQAALTGRNSPDFFAPDWRVWLAGHIYLWRGHGGF